MEQAMLQSLVTRSLGRRSDPTYQYRTLDATEKKKQAEEIARVKKELDMKRGKKKGAPKNAWTTVYEKQDPSSLAVDGRSKQSPAWDESSEDSFEFDQEMLAREEDTMYRKARIMDDDDLIDTIVELERERDERVKEVARLRREKLEAQRQACEATRLAQEATKRSIAVVKTKFGDYDEEDDLVEFEDDDPRVETRGNAAYSRKVRRELLSGSFTEYGLGERSPSHAVIRSAELVSPRRNGTHKKCKNQRVDYYDDEDEEQYQFEAVEEEKESISKNFDLLSSSIRERKKSLMEVEQMKKELEEEAHLNQTFKARPIPESTLQPRYKEMVEKAEAQSLSRKLERKERLKASIQPFRGLELRAMKQAARQKERERMRQEAQERDAERRKMQRKSNPYLAAKQAALEKAKRENDEMERKKKRDERAQTLLRESRLPKRLEEHEKIRQASKQFEVKQRQREFSETYTFKPNINHDVPDFDRTKEKWIDALTRARQKFRATEPNVSDLTMFSDLAKTKSEMRKQRMEEKQRKELELAKKEKRAKQRMVEQLRRASEKSVVSMTKSQELRLRVAAETKMKQMQAEQEEASKRELQQQRQKERAKVIREMVRRSEEKRKVEGNLTTLDDAQRKAREKAREDREKWKQRQEELRQLKSNPRPNRPALIEQHGESLRREDRRHDALARVAATLVANDAADDKVLTSEELDLVDETFQRATTPFT